MTGTRKSTDCNGPLGLMATAHWVVRGLLHMCHLHSHSVTTYTNTQGKVCPVETDRESVGLGLRGPVVSESPPCSLSPVPDKLWSRLGYAQYWEIKGGCVCQPLQLPLSLLVLLDASRECLVNGVDAFAHVHWSKELFMLSCWFTSFLLSWTEWSQSSCQSHPDSPNRLLAL